MTVTEADTGSTTDPPAGTAPDGRVGRAEGSLRRLAARGTVINGAFLVALQGLGLIKGFVVAAFLTTESYGVWGLLIITMATLLWLSQVGIDDKYIQQDHPDQEEAFQIAFTLECMLLGVFMVLIAAAVPVFALVYGRSDIIVPGLVLALAIPAAALQTPLWIFYRRMDYMRQRRLQALDPVVGFVLTVGLAAAGLGVWALVIGTVCGAWAAAVAAVRASPYRLRFRYQRGALREYASFSWPLFLAQASGVVIAQIPILVAQRSHGIDAVAAITLAVTISIYVARMDDVVTNTLYPAICAARDRVEVLYEAFSKSNRMALLWGLPAGVGIALFAPDLVHFVLGHKWDYAIGVIQVFGLIAGMNQIGFNWSAFYRAIGRSRPIAASAVVTVITTLGIAVPLLVTHGLDGFAVGMGIVTLVLVAMRWFFLARLFPALAMVRHVLRAALPTLPGLAVVGLLRLAGEGVSRTLPLALAEAVCFVLVTTGATAVLERGLLGEFVGYFRSREE